MIFLRFSEKNEKGVFRSDSFPTNAGNFIYLHPQSGESCKLQIATSK